MRMPLPHSVPLSVSNNGIDWLSLYETAAAADSYVRFTYVSPISVKALSPKSGPVEGGTGIIVHGSNFVSSDVLRCRFGSPHLGGVGAVTPGVFLSETRVRCVTPALPAGRISVELTTNNVDYTSNFVQFEYKVQSKVHSISPRFGSIEGGTRVMVTGQNFQETRTLYCRFGSAVELVRATWVASTLIECVSPSTVTVGETVLQVTSNMVDYTEVNSNAAVFTFTPSAFVTEILPRRGPELGGTLITVVGEGFMSPSGNLYNHPPLQNNNVTGTSTRETTHKCRFAGFVIVSAQLMNNTHMTCVVPAFDETAAQVSGAQKFVSVEVSSNGVQFEGLDTNGVAANFHYYESIQLLSIFPRSGPHEGGTTVTIRGQGFSMDEEDIVVLLGGVRCEVSLVACGG